MININISHSFFFLYQFYFDDVFDLIEVDCFFSRERQMMLPDSPQNLVVVRAPSPSVHYMPASVVSDQSSSILTTPSNHQQQLTTISTAQQAIPSPTQPVSESWCLTSVKVIKVGRC